MSAEKDKVRKAAEEEETKIIKEAKAIAGDKVADVRDRKSTRLNSSHTVISYAVFCLKKKKKKKKKNKKKQKKKKKQQ